MNQIGLLTLSVIGFLCLNLEARAADEGDRDAKAEQEVRAVEKQRVQALLSKDVASLSRMWADDFMQITHLGEYRNKRHREAAFKAGAVNYETITNDYDGFRIYGDVAIVTGIALRKGRDGNRNVNGQFRFTRVWVKKDQRWQLVHMQTTRYVQ